MTTMLLAAIVQTAFLGADPEAAKAGAETYAEARQKVDETGKPMVVMVSTDWCPPCQTMKKVVMPKVRELGLLRKVAFAVVNPDHDRDLAEKLTGGGPIPQLLMFRKSGDGWVRKKLVGGQDIETVEEFINDGLAKDEADKKPAAESDKKNAPPSHPTTANHDTASSGEDAGHRG